MIIILLTMQIQVQVGGEYKHIKINFSLPNQNK